MLGKIGELQPNSCALFANTSRDVCHLILLVTTQLRCENQAHAILIPTSEHNLKTYQG